MKKKYMILKYEKARTVQKMLGLTDEEFLNILTGNGYLTTERLSLGKDVLLRVGTYVDKKDAVAKFELNIPLGIGLGGIYEATKIRHEYGLNGSENNYFMEITESELKKRDEDIARKLYLIKTYRNYISTSTHMNPRILKNLALNELYITNAINGSDIRDMYKKEPEYKTTEVMQA